MIFRVYTLCWLTFACADEINRVQSSEASGASDAVAFGHYELEEIESEPDDMPAQSEDATLKDVKFISKISATESLLITEKNVTWKYDEEANTLQKISFSGEKEYDSGPFTQMGDIEYGFSQHLLRMYVENKTKAKLVVEPSMHGNFSRVVELDSSLYDDTKPPRILYLDAEETENRKVPSVLMFTWEKATSKGTYVLNSDAMTCGGTSPIPVKLNISREFNLSDTNIGVGGIASDGASFWVLTAKDFVLYVFHSCKQVEEEKEQGETVNKPVYDYKGIPTSKKLNVSYRGESASKLPLGVWIDVSQKDRPVIKGKIIAISENGKLLSADAPSAP